MAKAPTPAELEPEAAPAPEAAPEATPETNEDGLVLVETTGEFMLVDPISGAEIEAEGSTAVKMTSFIQYRLELGQLKVVG